MGIRFYDAAADLHYGYVRLTILIDSVAGDAEVELIKVYGYAWESSADTPIMAGDGYQPDAIHDLAVMELQIWPNPHLSCCMLTRFRLVCNKPAG